MPSITISEVREYVKQNIDTFHKNRLASLLKLSLGNILKRKNPYLFKAKNISLAQDLVETLLDAHLSSQEEAIFGNFLEGLAIYVNQKVYGGWKSAASGIDLEFDRDSIRYVVTVKSGPNWGNSGQIKNMKADFKQAKRILRTSNAKLNVVAVNGCCYGRDEKSDKGEYYKYCGQVFWEFISGDQDLYLQIIRPLGHNARRKNSAFKKEYAIVVNNFTAQFMRNFVVGGEIDWDALVRYNSASSQVKLKK